MSPDASQFAVLPSRLLDFARRHLDQVVSPEWQRQTWDRIVAFASARPLLSVSAILPSPPLPAISSFPRHTYIYLGMPDHRPTPTSISIPQRQLTNPHHLHAQSLLGIFFVLSICPLLIFVSFAVSTALVAALFAIGFTVFWIGLAALLLFPALLVSGSLALCLWLGAIAAFAAARRAYVLLASDDAPARATPAKVATTPPRSGVAAGRSSVAGGHDGAKVGEKAQPIVEL